MQAVSGSGALQLRAQFLAICCCYFRGEKTRFAGAKATPPDFDKHNVKTSNKPGVSYRRLRGFSSGYYNRAGYVRWMQAKYRLALDDSNALTKPLLWRLAQQFANMFALLKCAGAGKVEIEHLPRIAFEIMETRNFLAEALRMLDVENGKHALEDREVEDDEVCLPFPAGLVCFWI